QDSGESVPLDLDNAVRACPLCRVPWVHAITICHPASSLLPTPFPHCFVSSSHTLPALLHLFFPHPSPQQESGESVPLDLDNAVRACPLCRVRSHFVTPSVVWFFSEEEKQAIIEGYKRKLKSTDCRYFNYGNGQCPFGTSCFYKEVKLRHLSSADGSAVISRDIRLSDFLDPKVWCELHVTETQRVPQEVTTEISKRLSVNATRVQATHHIMASPFRSPSLAHLANVSLFVLSLAFVACRRAAAVVLLVEGKECLTEHLEANEAVTGSFVVIDVDSAWLSDAGTIDFEIIGPHNLKLYSAKRKSEDNFQFRSMYSGDYSFCMDNTDHMAATVQLSYHIGHKPYTHEVAKDEHMQGVLGQVESIRSGLVLVQQDQAYFQARDERRRRTNESTKQRVFWYALLEVLVLVLANGAQVLILHHLFNKAAARSRK
ncbi:unnamed protein product, partial [Closterium sp. NIES-54]